MDEDEEMEPEAPSFQLTPKWVLCAVLEYGEQVSMATTSLLGNLVYGLSADVNYHVDKRKFTEDAAQQIESITKDQDG